uniref:(northern house mosquito) hypothetical protein n=1 Tax=Culex pipiens TaxID=7175 RepID=A0A8D8NXH7_CULPI
MLLLHREPRVVVTVLDLLLQVVFHDHVRVVSFVVLVRRRLGHRLRVVRLLAGTTSALRLTARDGTSRGVQHRSLEGTHPILAQVFPTPLVRMFLLGFLNRSVHVFSSDQRSKLLLELVRQRDRPLVQQFLGVMLQLPFRVVNRRVRRVAGGRCWPGHRRQWEVDRWGWLLRGRDGSDYADRRWITG